MSQKTFTDTPTTIARSTFAFLSGTFLSRLSGLGRDTAMAIAFGSHPAIAAFMVAFRFSNLLRRLLGEGPLSSGFIPHFEQVRVSAPKKGAELFRDLFFSVGFLLVLLIGGLELILGGLSYWGNLHEGSRQILQLTLFMLPGMLFICLFGLSSSLLQCEKRFFLTGFAPVAFNFVWIAAVLFFRKTTPIQAVNFLSIAVVVGFLLQFLMLFPQTKSYLKSHFTGKEWFSPQIFSPELRQLIKPLLWGIIGVAAVQINTAFDGIFARFASLEGPAYLWYAIRIEQVPLALFGIALSSALLPSLARAIKERAHEQYSALLRFAFRRSFSLIFPCTLGIFCLGAVGINFLYGHGHFDQESTYQTILCLWGYGLGLLPSVFVLLLAPAFYANKEFSVPMFASLFSVLLNLALNSLFVFGWGWGAFSIAIATSLAAWFNYFFLSYALSKKWDQPLFDKSVFSSFFKTACSALIATIFTVIVGKFLVGDLTWRIFLGENPPAFQREFTTQLLQFIAMSGTFLLAFFSYAWMLNAQDVLELIGIKISKQV